MTLGNLEESLKVAAVLLELLIEDSIMGAEFDLIVFCFGPFPFGWITDTERPSGRVMDLSLTEDSITGTSLFLFDLEYNIKYKYFLTSLL